MSRRRGSKHRTRLTSPQNQRQVNESARGERAVSIVGYDSHDESEAILAALPGGTIAERLDSARRGLFLDQDGAETTGDQSRPGSRGKPKWEYRVTPQLVCGCGYIARIELMNEHQDKHNYRGKHGTRVLFESEKPDPR